MKQLLAVLLVLSTAGCAALADSYYNLQLESNARDWSRAQGEANWLMRATPAEFMYRYNLAR